MRYYLIAGEASGDLHGSNLISELRKQDADADFRFMGGDLMQTQAGSQPVLHYSQMAFMGFVKVMLNLRTIGRNLKKCKADIIDYKPDVVVLIDFAGFNLRVAKFAKSIGIKTVFYISPKIWAWKQNRIRKIKSYIDKMLTILPFETEFYKRFDYEVEYVGNPLLDAISTFRCDESEQSFRVANNLNDKPIIALLAGSRKQEVTSMLPLMMEMNRYFTDYQFVISGAPGLTPDFYQTVLGCGSTIPIVYNQTYKLLTFSYAALVTSGTATLETALFGVPQVVCYTTIVPNFLYRIGRKFLKVRWISLVNLIASKEAVRELVQVDFKKEQLTAELQKIVGDTPQRQQMLADYANLRQRMGVPGASVHAAKAIINFCADKK